MGRIVPRSYETEDSQTVQELGDFVQTLHPDWVHPEFGRTFVEFAEKHGARLRQLYGVHLVDRWPPVPKSQQPPAAGGPSGTDPRLGYVFYEKMSEDLRRALNESGIALPDPGDPRWIGMHPRMSHVYMTALADQLAGERGLYPLTDETVDHLAVGGWTVERLAQALLEDVDLVQAPQGPAEVESAAACVAIRTVLPKDLDQLPVERILEFREKYPGERAAFQQQLSAFVTPREWLENIDDPAALEQRLEDEYQKQMKPKVDELREKWREANIDSVSGTLAIRVAAPAIAVKGAALMGVAANPVGGLVAGAALAMVTVLRDRRKARRELASSPLAYLLRMEHELRPRQVTDWIREGMKKFRTSTGAPTSYRP